MGGVNNLGTSMSFKGTLVKTKIDLGKASVSRGVGVVALGHECLMFGGFTGDGERHRVHRYDRLKRKWKSVLPRNREKSFGSIRMTFVVDDILYAYVWYGNAYKHGFLALDLILMEEWVAVGKGSLMQAGFGASGCYVALRNEGVLFGGPQSNVVVYNVERSSWYSPEVSGTLPSPRKHCATCCVGQRMFIVGGHIPEGNDNVLDLHILTMYGTRFSWSTPVTTGAIPPKRSMFTATYASGRVFVYGGSGGYKRFDVYSIKQNRWYNGSSAEADAERGIVHFTSQLFGGNAVHAAVVVDGKLLIFGGSFGLAKIPLEIAPY